jgi:hypothetical protein
MAGTDKRFGGVAAKTTTGAGNEDCLGHGEIPF